MALWFAVSSAPPIVAPTPSRGIQMASAGLAVLALRLSASSLEIFAPLAWPEWLVAPF